jgi:hypothetical protein
VRNTHKCPAFCEGFGLCPYSSRVIQCLLVLRNARAFPLLPEALAFVSFGFVLVRVRVRVVIVPTLFPARIVFQTACTLNEVTMFRALRILKLHRNAVHTPRTTVLLCTKPKPNMLIGNCSHRQRPQINFVDRGAAGRRAAAVS